MVDRDARTVASPAVRLALAVSRLRARSREEADAPKPGLSMSQWAILVRIIGTGPATASELASSEHVSQQAIAQSVAPLKAAGLLQARPDATDRRKSRLDVTPQATRLVHAVARDSWLSRAIEAEVAPQERDALEAAIDLLERLAATELDHPHRTPRRTDDRSR